MESTATFFDSIHVQASAHQWLRLISSHAQPMSPESQITSNVKHLVQTSLYFDRIAYSYSEVNKLVSNLPAGQPDPKIAAEIDEENGR